MPEILAITIYICDYICEMKPFSTLAWALHSLKFSPDVRNLTLQIELSSSVSVIHFFPVFDHNYRKLIFCFSFSDRKLTPLLKYFFIYFTYVSTLLLSSDTPDEGVGSHYRWLWATKWLLGIELRTLGRVFLTTEPSLLLLPGPNPSFFHDVMLTYMWSIISS